MINMFAVIKLSGKQRIVKKGDTILTSRLKVGTKKEINLSEVLAVFDDKSTLKLGTPSLKNVKVKAEVVAPEELGKKVKIVKFKSKKRYKKTTGYRDKLTKLKIKSIA